MSMQRRAIPITAPSALFAGALLLAGCASSDASRDAAAPPSLPACSAGLAPTCLVPLEAGATPVAIHNGSTVVFDDPKQPAAGLSVGPVCWAGEGEVDADTCVDSEQDLPTWITVQRSSSPIDGLEYPALTIGVRQIPDQDGELFVPLPATLRVTLGQTPNPPQVTLEVACCDIITNEGNP